MNKHIMLDLETMGNGNNAAIVAIGACSFDPYDASVEIQPYYQRITLQSSVDFGLKMDASTVLWWMQQKDAAKIATFDGQAMPLGDALWAFSKWVGGDYCVWGNGATFDNVIIRSAFAACKLEPPWKFFNDRCYRTLKALVDIPYVFEGTKHFALDDAISQAKHLQKIYAKLGLK